MYIQVISDFLPFSGFQKKTLMDRVNEIFVATLIGTFLLNTDRARKCLELCKQCLIFLSLKAWKNQKELFRFVYRWTWSTMLNGCYVISEHTNEMGCCRKFLNFLRACVERAQEGKVAFHEAKFYQLQLIRHKEAKELYKKALSITIEERKREGMCHVLLRSVHQSLEKYGKANECLKKVLVTSEETGDLQIGEAVCFETLAVLHHSVNEYDKAENCQKKALVIGKETFEREKEATHYENLGAFYYSLAGYGKAKEYHDKALVIRKELGDRAGEAKYYANQGAVYQSLGQYGKAEDYQKKALVIRKEIGDKSGEVSCYGNLGILYQSLGEYGKAEDYQTQAVVIAKEIGDRRGEAECYGNLGNVYQSLGDYGKAEEHQKKALVINEKIGCKKGEAACYGNLGNVYMRLGEYGKAEEYYRRALVIEKEIGDKKQQAVSYGNLGTLFRSLGEHARAKEYHEKALALNNEIGDIEQQLIMHFDFACDMLSEGNKAQHEIVSDLFTSVHTFEKMLAFLRDNDEHTISFFHKHPDSYYLLSALFCKSGNPYKALCVVELGRANAVADLMPAQFSVKQHISVNPQSYIERILENENDCTCLYLSYWACYMLLWVLKANKPISFRQIDVNKCLVNKVKQRNVDEVFSETVRKFRVLPQRHCEDRTLLLSNESHPTGESSQQDGMSASRLEEDEEDESQQTVPTLAECYKMIIAPVADFLDKPEIIIVPDRLLYNVPFAALKDESDKYLSETFRIRIVPSLLTHKLIQDSRVDYHSQTGALIVGDPDVGEVFYKGRIEKLCPLPCARREAEMVGKLLGVQPLLGKQATKQAVLDSIQSVSLIHFAAHGNAERGEIALAHQSPINIPPEEDYLLTTADISKVRLRAKLVVLSCCHSAHGQFRAEGVVGIFRAFLGSGARAVLVAHWALGDSATEQLMRRFYEHLFRGDSAGESLHQAMKWMRTNGYSDVRDWAPFVLIGDNVTLDFGK